jgi:hypothetical protein
MALLIAGVIWKDESFLADPNDREWDHIAPFKWWLPPHGIGGAVALFLGPFQFSETLPRRNLALHRVLGRFYMGGIFISAPLSLYIGYNGTPVCPRWKIEPRAATGFCARCWPLFSPSSATFPAIASGSRAPMPSPSSSSWRERPT